MHFSPHSLLQIHFIFCLKICKTYPKSHVPFFLTLSQVLYQNSYDPQMISYFKSYHFNDSKKPHILNHLK